MDTSVLEYRSVLLRLASDILRNKKDAEDAVQETYMKWFAKTDTSHIEQKKSYLVASLRNTCLNWLDRAKCFQNVQQRVAQEIREVKAPAGFFDAERQKELQEAFQTMMKKLNGQERGVYILRELFNCDYSDISEIMEKKAENCRQILNRARQRLLDRQARFELDMEACRKKFQVFQRACHSGSLNEMINAIQSDFQKSSK
ncbi:MAG: RNA polymerase sigma factor [Cytophagales bacterium]|nr:RNA polymerase sigma factor [Cytophagales bacterium]